MILGISSLGEGRWRILRRASMWMLHAGGGAFGGAATMGMVWLLAASIRMLPRVILIGVLLAITLASILADLRVLPHIWTGRQVPAGWARRYGLVRGFGLYGLVLGSGLLTHVPYAAVFGVFGAAALFLPLGEALVIGALFGVGRTFFAGPAALAASFASKVLYRSPASHWIWPKVSAMVGAFIGAKATFSLM